MIRLSCPSCGQQLQLRDSAASKMCRCPKCRNTIRVPNAQEQHVREATRSQGPDPGRDARIYSLMCEWKARCEKGEKISATGQNRK